MAKRQTAAEAARENTTQAPQTAETVQENTAQTAASAPESATQPPEQPSASLEAQTTDEKAQTENREEPALEDIAALAIRHRVAAWEQAALLRMMGWADGKMTTDAEYRAALARLHGRRLGGGRMA
ncbi:hypothetical protein [uncultured Desulfovibrio sp.]|uniref:hypothetical protein n=1 Tax=uncultured Desulfovibrio sp. TaxID=167968 RepID=UPI00272D2BFF|nr:hypothetical protein [uncultured Desulfovibrio sp.]